MRTAWIRFTRLGAGLLLVASSLVIAPAAVSADEQPELDARVQAIIDALIASGVPVDSIDADFVARIGRSVRQLLDDGVIEEDDLDDLVDIDKDDLGERLGERVERGRTRQQAYRDAVNEAVDELGYDSVAELRRALRDDPELEGTVRDLLPTRHEVWCDRENDDSSGDGEEFEASGSDTPSPQGEHRGWCRQAERRRAATGEDGSSDLETDDDADEDAAESGKGRRGPQQGDREDHPGRGYGRGHADGDHKMHEPDTDDSVDSDY